MSTTPKLLIIAGNARQADTWRRERNLTPTEAPYAYDYHCVLGYVHGTRFVKVGTWDERRENIELLAAMQQRGYEEIRA